MFKKEIITKIKNILHSYHIFETLNPSDFKYMINLLNNHPRAKQKIGIGISYIKIIKSKFNKFAFQIVRKDGSTTDFSYLKCVNRAIPSHLQDIKKACRNAISDDILSLIIG